LYQGKTAAQRFVEEDSGLDGTRLVNQLRLHLGAVRQLKHVEYESAVILNHSDLIVISSDTGLPLDTVTNIAELVVIKRCLFFGISYFHRND